MTTQFYYDGGSFQVVATRNEKDVYSVSLFDSCSGVHRARFESGTIECEDMWHALNGKSSPLLIHKRFEAFAETQG